MEFDGNIVRLGEWAITLPDGMDARKTTKRLKRAINKGTWAVDLFGPPPASLNRNIWNRVA